MARFALSFDIGGTFTDFVLFEIGGKQIRAVHKVLTTAREPALGVLQGWRDLLAAHHLAASDIALAVHSTTLVTNTIIERQGAVAGLLTTEGYRDVLEIGAEQIYDIYDLFAPYPAPLIAREHCLEVGERLGFDGRVIEPLDPDEVIAAVRRLAHAGVEAVAISFLHSYADPCHEQRAEQAIKEVFPDLDVSISSRVAPLIGEYERTSTVAADAYVKPKVRRYLNDLVARLHDLGFKHDLNVMLSATVPNNEGTFRPISVMAPPGSILNCTPPASVNSRTQTGWHLHSLIFGALARALPDRVQAGNGLMFSFSAYGQDDAGHAYNAHFFAAGGRGASQGRDGIGRNCFPSSARNVPTEIFESRAPILIRRRALQPNSAGAGQWRGALGQEIVLSKLPGTAAPISCACRPNRLHYPPPGLAGGQDGQCTEVLLNDARMPDEILDAGHFTLRHDDDRVTVRLPGGAGYGPADLRDSAALAAERSKISR